MITHRSKIIGFAALMAVAISALPTSASAYETDKCGPMCHLPLDVHGAAGKRLGPRSGSFEDMKRHFNIGPGQEQAWENFQKAVFNRMLTAFDAENINDDALIVRPEEMDGETYAPILSVELIEKWNKVLKTYDELKGVLDKDRQNVADRIRMICEQIK